MRRDLWIGLGIAVALSVAAIATPGAILLRGTAHAGDSEQRFYSFGGGAQSCAVYVAVRQTETSARAAARGRVDQIFTRDYQSFFYFAEGWVSATNALTPATYNMLPAGMEAAMLWLESHCRKNPMHGFAQALGVMLVELYPDRVTQNNGR